MSLAGGSNTLPEKHLRLNLQTHWFKMILVGGVGAGGSLAIVLGLFDLMQRDPKEMSSLLRAWGPWALIVAFAMALLSKWVQQAMGLAREGLRSLITTNATQAEAQARTADALTRLADQGGRSAEEVRRLTVYAAQEFPSVYLRFDKQDELLKTTGEAVAKIADSMLALHRRLDEDNYLRGRREEDHGNRARGPGGYATQGDDPEVRPSGA